MKCAYCGKNNKPGALVCKRCGIALPVEPPAGKPFSDSTDMVETGKVIDAEVVRTPDHDVSGKKVRMSKKTAAVTACAVLFVALLAAVIILVAVNAGSIILPGNNSYTVYTDAVIFNGEAVRPDGALTLDAASSFDGTRVALKTTDGDLYVCSKGTYRLAARNVDEYTISSGGRYVIYSDGAGLLWSCDVKDASSAPVCITNDAANPSFAVSPDGKSVLFVKRSDSTLYAYVNGKLRAIGQGFEPVSISDGGKYIYCYRLADNSLYYVNKRDKQIFVRSNIGENISLNSRHDEIVFSADSGNGIVATMICVRGGDAKEILLSDSAAAPVMPVSAIKSVSPVSRFEVSSFPVKSFDNRLFYGSKLLSFSFRSGAKDLCSNAVSMAKASDNYGKVLYVTGGRLYSMSVRSGEADKLADSCSDFTLSANGRIVWYVDLGSSLHAIRSGSDQLIARNVQSFTVLPSGRQAAFIKDGSLCLNKNGRPGQTFVFEGFDAIATVSDARGHYYKTQDGIWKKLGAGGKRTDLSK
ncbi:MAG: hypothetical protein K6F68_03550 [Clostridiales bacterium]|nr:hypothetical protein [Clostridiales bacterium]